MYNWVTLLYSGYWHNTVSQVYFHLKANRTESVFYALDSCTLGPLSCPSHGYSKHLVVWVEPGRHLPQLHWAPLGLYCGCLGCFWSSLNLPGTCAPRKREFAGQPWAVRDGWQWIHASRDSVHQWTLLPSYMFSQVLHSNNTRIHVEWDSPHLPRFSLPGPPFWIPVITSKNKLFAH